MQENPEIAVLTEAFEAPAEPDVETQLASEIGELWSVHTQRQTVLGHTQEELRNLRLELGRRLHEMKLRLACPGRAGQWSKFLSAHGIPRASADRYAKKYEHSLNPPDEIASSDAIQESPEETVRKLLQNIWPKLRELLTDRGTAYQFLCALVQRCDTLQAEITESGIAIRKPTTIDSQFSCGSRESKNALAEAAVTVEHE